MKIGGLIKISKELIDPWGNKDMRHKLYFVEHYDETVIHGMNMLIPSGYIHNDDIAIVIAFGPRGNDLFIMNSFNGHVGWVNGGAFEVVK